MEMPSQREEIGFDERDRGRKTNAKLIRWEMLITTIGGHPTRRIMHYLSLAGGGCPADTGGPNDLSE